MHTVGSKIRRHDMTTVIKTRMLRMRTFLLFQVNAASGLLHDSKDATQGTLTLYAEQIVRATTMGRDNGICTVRRDCN